MQPLKRVFSPEVSTRNPRLEGWLWDGGVQLRSSSSAVRGKSGAEKSGAATLRGSDEGRIQGEIGRGGGGAKAENHGPAKGIGGGVQWTVVYGSRVRCQDFF